MALQSLHNYYYYYYFSRGLHFLTLNGYHCCRNWCYSCSSTMNCICPSVLSTASKDRSRLQLITTISIFATPIENNTTLWLPSIHGDWQLFGRLPGKVYHWASTTPWLSIDLIETDVLQASASVTAKAAYL